jgi:hypothetical protein
MAVARRSRAKATLEEGKVVIGMSDYDPSKDQGYSGDEPKRGVYTFELVDFGLHESGEGNRSIRWVFQIADGPYQGWRDYLYTNLDSTKWKTQQITYALTGDQKDVAVDLSDTPKGETSRAKFIASTKLVRANVFIEASKSDEYDDRARMGKVMLLDEDLLERQAKAKKGTTQEVDEEDLEDEDDFEDAEEFDDEDEETDEDEDEEEDDEDDEDEEDEDEEEEEPEPAPARRRAKATKKAAPAKKTAAKAARPSARRTRR